MKVGSWKGKFFLPFFIFCKIVVKIKCYDKGLGNSMLLLFLVKVSLFNVNFRFNKL